MKDSDNLVIVTLNTIYILLKWVVNSIVISEVLYKTLTPEVKARITCLALIGNHRRLRCIAILQSYVCQYIVLSGKIAR